jgi:hypothetical protein
MASRVFPSLGCLIFFGSLIPVGQCLVYKPVETSLNCRCGTKKVIWKRMLAATRVPRPIVRSSTCAMQCAYAQAGRHGRVSMFNRQKLQTHASTPRREKAGNMQTYDSISSTWKQLAGTKEMAARFNYWGLSWYGLTKLLDEFTLIGTRY